MRSSTAGKAWAAEVIGGSVTTGMSGCPAFAGHDKRKSPPQNATQRPADDRAPHRAAHRTADRLAEIGGDLAGELVGHRTRDFARDQLTRGQALAARPAGAEDRTEPPAKLIENAALLRWRALWRTRRCPAPLTNRGRESRVVRAPLQHLVGGVGIHRLIVLPFDRTILDDSGPLLRADRPDTRRRRPHYAALDHRGRAVTFQKRDQRLAFSEFADHRRGVQLGIGAERFRRGAHRLLI